MAMMTSRELKSKMTIRSSQSLLLLLLLTPTSIIQNLIPLGIVNALPQNPYGASAYNGGGSPLKPPPSHNNQYPQQQQPPDDDGAQISPAFGMPDYSTGPRESFEDRVAEWRRRQQEEQQHRTAAEAASPTDESGRMKLLATVSNASICFFFFVLMWRAVHHYECADVAFKGTARLVAVFLPVVLFVGNMAGCVASLTSPSHSSKKRLKAILNLNKLLESALFLYNIFRLTIYPSRFIPKEIYVGRTLTNFIFIVQCQLFTKVAWNAARQTSGTYSDDYQESILQESQYDEQEKQYTQDQWQQNDGYQQQQYMNSQHSQGTSDNRDGW